MRLRPIVSAFAALALAAGLAACSGDAPDPTASTDATTVVDVCATPSGSDSDAVKVTGDLGTAPTVEFTAGIDPSETQRTVVIEGDGAELTAGGSAKVAYAIYNGTSGDIIEAYGYDEGQDQAVFAADVSQLLPGLAKAIGCLNEGTRVVAVIPAAEAFGEEGNADINVAGTDSIVAVIDIQSVVPTKADGVDQPATAGLPTVELADDGTPTVTIPEGDAPTELELGVLKKGSGEVVPEGATVTVQYQGVLWSTGEVFDQSWGRGPTSFSLDGVVPGFAQAIQGQTVGSQVIAVIPPALGYGDTAQSAIPAGSTLVFVVDILAIG
ncbi:FKBP-type peptidyl-prolyl cis-trans isomerase [Amnibacterium flavum]|uniref:peptidylprolyl isomerase n=1 Tax=Amnibacterium flavum TaxID=2173173 RepID=A0A2V1HQ32_9MICO|nr:FKBP-type peptidyl-prolyl cis-trans isomerase [Amnibacterium flavum]PVZ94716.1 peptidylprolyl isomerase [Amnibacterium flavum]